MRKRTQQGGFTLIELMIVVSIIGILTIIVLPQYRDYAVRTKVSELILAASAARQPVAEAAQVAGSMPTTVNMVSQVGTWTASTAYTRTSGSVGVITALANAKDLELSGLTITLTGNLQGNGQVLWTCSGSIPTRFRPTSCQP